MSRRVRVGISTFAAVLVLLGAVGAALAAPGDNAAEKAARIGQLARAALSAPRAPVLLIGGVPVDEATLQLHEAAGRVGGKPAGQARRDAIDGLKRQIALDQELIRRRIVATEAEVDGFISEWKAREQHPEALSVRGAHLRAIGQTEDEYWASAVVRGVARQTIARNYLAEQVAPGAEIAVRLVAVDRLIGEIAARMVVSDAR